MPTVTEVLNVIAMDLVLACLWWIVLKLVREKAGIYFWVFMLIFNLIPCSMLALVIGLWR